MQCCKARCSSFAPPCHGRLPPSLTLQTHTLLSPAEKREASQCLKLLCYCLDALHVTLSVGYEAALRTFVHQFAPFALEAASAGSVGVGVAAGGAAAGSGMAPAGAAAMEEGGPTAAPEPEPAQELLPAETAAADAAEPMAVDPAEPAAADKPAAGGKGAEQPAASSKVPLNALLGTLVNKLTEEVVDLGAISDAFR